MRSTRAIRAWLIRSSDSISASNSREFFSGGTGLLAEDKSRDGLVDVEGIVDFAVGMEADRIQSLQAERDLVAQPSLQHFDSPQDALEGNCCHRLPHLLA